MPLHAGPAFSDVNGKGFPSVSIVGFYDAVLAVHDGLTNPPGNPMTYPKENRERERKRRTPGFIPASVAIVIILAALAAALVIVLL